MESKYKLRKELHKYVEPRVQKKVLSIYEWMVLGWNENALDLENPIK